MSFILMSLLKTHVRDKHGNRVAVALENTNGVLDNIRAFTPRFDELVVVANDPLDFDDNDEKIETVKKSFELTGMAFKRATVLDGRNSSRAETVKTADLVVLSGGKCLCQKKFFDEIGLKDLLAGRRGLTIGVSAGAMNLCGTVANFPEEQCDLAEPRWLIGLGFFDGIVIPHFDGGTKKYLFDCAGLNVVRDYILPMSRGREFIGLDNDAYIVVDGGRVGYYGNVCKISDGRVKKL